MRENSLWRGVFGVEKTIIEDVVFDEDEGHIVASVRPTARQRSRCAGPPRRCWS